MAFQITDDGAASLRNRIRAAVTNPKTDIPGTVVTIVNQTGDLIFSEACGQLGADTNDAMTVNNIFWLASCTKLILTIATMQLVEKGQLELDNPDQVERLCPKLKTVKIVKRDEKGKLYYVEKTKRITLRMLLTHTAGFNYAAYHPELRDWVLSHGGNHVDFDQPLVTEPGEDWNYGFNNEWLCPMIEQISGQRIGDYMQAHIFEPLGLADISLFPTDSMKNRLVKISSRSYENESLNETAHFMQAVLQMSSKEWAETSFQNGGGGCFARPQDYCAVIAMILNNGTSSTTGAQILKKATIDTMFTNQIPNLPNFARKGIPDAMPDQTFPIPELYPVQPDNEPQGWGISFFLNLTPTPQGRAAMSASWAGMANCYWWADRENGVGGFVAAQIIPFYDPKVLKLYRDVETIVYSNRKSVKV